MTYPYPAARKQCCFASDRGQFAVMGLNGSPCRPANGQIPTQNPFAIEMRILFKSNSPFALSAAEEAQNLSNRCRIANFL